MSPFSASVSLTLRIKKIDSDAFFLEFSVFLWTQKSITLNCSLKRFSLYHFALTVIWSFKYVPPNHQSLEVRQSQSRFVTIYSKGVPLLTCSWRFFKSATAFGRSDSSTSYGRGRKEKTFPQDYKTEHVRWKSPLSPSNTPDFLPSHSGAHAASPQSPPASQVTGKER